GLSSPAKSGAPWHSRLQAAAFLTPPAAAQKLLEKIDSSFEQRSADSARTTVAAVAGMYRANTDAGPRRFRTRGAHLWSAKRKQQRVKPSAGRPRARGRRQTVELL